MLIRCLVPALVCLISGLPALAAERADPRPEFWSALQALCGQAFAGHLLAYAEPMDSGWLGEELVMHVRECSDDEIRIPLHVGDNRSRTWVISRTDDGFRLKHDHRNEAGDEDGVTWYGGHTTDPGRAFRQTFPVDDFSRALFLTNDLAGSVTNLWTVEVRPGQYFGYELTRLGRNLKVRFDLSEPVDLPPPPWGQDG